MTTMADNKDKKVLKSSIEREQSQTCLNSAEREKIKGSANLNVPHLRFPEFSGEWEETTLGKISEITKGSGISKDQLSEQGSPCILYGELYTKYKSEIIGEVYSRTELDSSSLVKSKANDVIIPCSGETAIDISTARCVPFNNILLGGDLNIIRLKNDDGGFFAYQLNGVRKTDIARVAQGVSVVHLYGENLKQITVYHPAIEEQKKITRLLSLIDERIATQNKIIEDLKKLKSAISHILFSSKGAIHLSEIANVVMGQSPSSNAYNDQGLGMPLVQGNLDISNGKTTPRLYTAEFNQTTEKGNIILTVRAPVGEVAKATQKVCLGRGVCAIIPHEENMSDFIYQYLTFYKFMWRRYEQGSTFTSINGSDVRNIFCPKVRNVSILTLLDIKINIEERVVKQYQSQKQYMLYQMFI